MNLTLDSFILLIKIDTFLLLYAFLMEGFPNYANEPEENCPNAYDSNQDNSPSMEVDIKTNKLSFCFLSDSLQNASQDILYVSSEFSFNFQKAKLALIKQKLNEKIEIESTYIQIKAAVKDMNVVIHNLNDLCNKSNKAMRERKIMNQASITLDTDINLRKSSRGDYSFNNKVRAFFEEIDITVSSRDAIIALSIHEYKNSLLLDDFQNKKNALTQPKSKVEMSKISKEIKNDNDSFQLLPKEKGIQMSQINANSNDQDDFDINVSGTNEIRIMLVNHDIETYYPFLSIVLKTFLLICKSSGDYSTGSLSFALQAYSFNYVASYWEPFIEYLPLYSSINIDSSSENKRLYSFNVIIEHKDTINVNISDLSLEFIYNNLSIWLDRFSNLRANYKSHIGKIINLKQNQAISNHKVFNYTGKAMTLISDTEQYLIEENQSFDVEYFPDSCNEVKRKKAVEKKEDSKKQYAFTLKNEEIANSLIDIKSLKWSSFTLTTRGNCLYNYVVSKGELTGLKKHIYFYSPLVFKNRTEKMIKMIFSENGLQSRIFDLFPGKMLGVPAEYFDSSMVMIFDDESWKLSTRDLLTNPQDIIEKKIKTKFYMLSYQKQELNPFNNRILEIRHSYQIKNGLPVNVLFTEKASKNKYYAKKNQTIFIDCLSYYSVLKVAIELEGLSIETEVEVFDPRKPERIKQVQLRSYTKGSTIEITIYQYNYSERLVVLYAEYVLVNLGGDGLVFSHGNKKFKLDPIPNQFKNINMFLLNQNTHFLLQFDYKEGSSNVINFKEISSYLELKCSTINKKGTKGEKKEYDFVLESSLSLIDKEYSIYSTVLTLSPKYFIVNLTNIQISLQFDKTKITLILFPDQKTLFDFSGLDTNTEISLQPLELLKNQMKWKRSYPFTLLSENLLTLQFGSNLINEKLYLNIEKSKERMSTILYITIADKCNAQFVFNNKTTNFECIVYQKKYNNNNISSKPGTSSCFAFTNPVDKHIICFTNDEWNFSREISFNDSTYTLTNSSISKDYTYSTHQVISLRQMKSNLKITVDSDHFQVLITFSEEDEKRADCSQKEETVYEMHFKISSLGVSLIGDNRNIGFDNILRKYSRTDILYLQLKEVLFYFKTKVEEKSSVIQFCLREARISNESAINILFPMVFAPLPEEAFFNEESEEEHIPLISILLDYKIGQENKMLVNGLDICFQPFKLKAESNFVLCLYNFIQNLTSGTHTSITFLHPIYSSAEENLKNNIIVQGSFVLMTANKHKVREANIVIDWLYIPSFKVRLSFANQSNDFFKKVLQNNEFLTHVLGAMSSVDDVPLFLNGCEIQGFVGGWKDLLSSIGQHYKEHIMRQGYKIFGGISLLGSPNTFLALYSRGVNDFFKEPRMGFKKGPLQGFAGIAKGGASFVQHTIEGAFNSTSQATSGISKALLLISQDDEYMKKRETLKITEKPKNAIEGVGFGMKSFATGLLDGITGVVMQPIKGAKEDKLKGFGLGLLKGFGGMVSKPVSGLFDLVSKTTEGIKQNVSSEGIETQLRSPRVFYGKFKLVKPYNSVHSDALYVIRKGTNEYDLENLGFLACCDLVIGKHKKQYLFLLTSEGLMMFNQQNGQLTSTQLPKSLLNYDEIKDFELLQGSLIVLHLTDGMKIVLEIDPNFCDMSYLTKKLKQVIFEKINKV